MNTLLFERNIPRFAASRIASTLGSGKGVGFGPLRLVDGEPPRLPGENWFRLKPILSGICGSDLATVDGRSSRYFEDIVSFPFVPGHEVLAVVEDGQNARSADGTALEAGTRVVIEPVLGCVARSISPVCPSCRDGYTGGCENTSFGHLRPGLQTGFCSDTGGGWSEVGLVAHQSQIHVVPDELGDRDAVTLEPIACAVHAVLRAGITDSDIVAVLGAGTLGLGVVAGISTMAQLKHCDMPKQLLVGAKYSHQQRFALNFGASDVLDSTQLLNGVRRYSRSLSLGKLSGSARRLAGGADIVIDCVGTSQSISQALSIVRPRGRIVLVGMPGKLNLDLASLWHREVTISGAYAYGLEKTLGQKNPVNTFELAMEVVARHKIGQIVSATYPIERFEEALQHAGSAGRRGAVKIAFDLQSTNQKTLKGRLQ